MPCVLNVLACISLASMYVGSLYVWRNSHNRDHPSTVKKRFISVFFMTIISSIFVVVLADESHFTSGHSYWSLLGLRTEGLLYAILLPLLLVVILFFGPLVLHYTEGTCCVRFDVTRWRYYLTDVICLRNLVVAPFSEEYTFRACMLPILVPCFENKTAVILCPLFFGVAHLHHMKNKLSHGSTLKGAILQSLFLCSYTTLFGAYSSYLFLRTGHFAAPFVSHMFCNYMEFPDFGLLLSLKKPKKLLLMLCFLAGLILWMFLLNPLTNPNIYSNTLFWN